MPTLPARAQAAAWRCVLDGKESRNPCLSLLQSVCQSEWAATPRRHVMDLNCPVKPTAPTPCSSSDITSSRLWLAPGSSRCVLCQQNIDLPSSCDTVSSLWEYLSEEVIMNTYRWLDIVPVSTASEGSTTRNQRYGLRTPCHDGRWLRRSVAQALWTGALLLISLVQAGAALVRPANEDVSRHAIFQRVSWSEGQQQGDLTSRGTMVTTREIQGDTAHYRIWVKGSLAADGGASSKKMTSGAVGLDRNQRTEQVQFSTLGFDLIQLTVN